MAKRWLIGGMAVGVAALVVIPEGRTWLRRRFGLEPEDRRWFEEEGGEVAEYEGDEPLDTRESRFSLRARLSEDGHAEPEGAVAPEAFVAPEAPEAAPEPAAEPAPPFAAAAPEPAVETAPEPELEATPEPELEAPPEPELEATPEPELEATPEPAWAIPDPAPLEPSPFAAMDPPAAEPELEPFPPQALPQPAPFGAMETPEPHAVPAEPEAAPEPEPESTPFSPAHDTGYMTYESVPAISPETDAPKAPGEDTDEVEPIPPASAWDPGVAVPNLPPPELRPAPSRPFSEGTSFRSAIDAARERVHGSAREATPGESDDEPADESASTEDAAASHERQRDV
jgi:nicotinate-nucleotide--dimethylbenzimidazole phosphoribosyltransferase